MSGGWRVRLSSQGSLLAVFLLCGLWHGATWVFVAWGGLHGLYIVSYEVWHHWRGQRPGSAEARPGRAGVVSAWLITQGALLLSWVLFRASTFGGFVGYLDGLAGRAGPMTVTLSALTLAAFAAFVIDHVAGWVMEHHPAIRTSIPVYARAIYYVALMLFLFHARPERVSPFIYFQF